MRFVLNKTIQAENVEYSKYFGSMITLMQDVHVKLNPKVPWQISIEQKGLFHQQIGLEFKEGASEVLHLEHCFVWCWNLDTSESRSELAGNLFKCGVGEGWSRSVGPIV
jgi:hypothetical protein